MNLNDCTGLPGITDEYQLLGLSMGIYPPTHFPPSSVAAHDKSMIVLTTIFPSSDSTDKAFSPDIFTLELEFKMMSLANTSRATPYFHSRESPIWLIKEWFDSANRSKSLLSPLLSKTAAEGSLVFIWRVSPGSKVNFPAIRGINDTNEYCLVSLDLQQWPNTDLIGRSEIHQGTGASFKFWLIDKLTPPQERFC